MPPNDTPLSEALSEEFRAEEFKAGLVASTTPSKTALEAAGNLFKMGLLSDKARQRQVASVLQVAYAPLVQMGDRLSCLLDDCLKRFSDECEHHAIDELLYGRLREFKSTLADATSTEGGSDGK